MKNKISYPSLRWRYFIGLFLIGLFYHSFPMQAQVAFMAGMNYSDIRNETFIPGKKGIFGSRLGFSVQYQPFRCAERISVINEFNYEQRGYRQHLDQTYKRRFDYLTFSVLMDYKLVKSVSLQGGVEFAGLVKSNIKYWDKTYNDFDFGFVFGTEFKIMRKISVAPKLTYGLLPMLDYYDIDEMGTFRKNIHDLRNITWSVGLKFYLYNEKIKLYN